MQSAARHHAWFMPWLPWGSRFVSGTVGVGGVGFLDSTVGDMAVRVP